MHTANYSILYTRYTLPRKEYTLTLSERCLFERGASISEVFILETYPYWEGRLRPHYNNNNKLYLKKVQLYKNQFSNANLTLILHY
jgi:hypothetical protein